MLNSIELNWIDEHRDIIDRGDPDEIISSIWRKLGFQKYSLVFRLAYLLKLPFTLRNDRFANVYSLDVKFGDKTEVLTIYLNGSTKKSEAIEKLKSELLPKYDLPKVVFDYIISQIEQEVTN